MKPIAPCKDCQRRYIACHADCHEYHDWLTARAEDKEKVQRAYQTDGDYITFKHRQRMERNRTAA